MVGSRQFNPNRWKLAYSMIRAMIVVTIPAAVSLWLLLQLLDIIHDGGGILAWAALILLAPFALVMTVIAVTVDFFSGLGLIATLLSRKIKTVNVTSFGSPLRPPMRPVRDVTPDGPIQTLDIEARPAPPRDVSPDTP